MNREYYAKMLPIIKAFSEGAVVEIKRASGKWEALVNDAAFTSDPSYYRIKREPAVRWGVWFGNTYQTSYTTKNEAEGHVDKYCGPLGRTVKLVEEIE